MKEEAISYASANDLIKDLMPADAPKAKKKEEKPYLWGPEVNFRTELPDFEEGWIYQKIGQRNPKKGKRLRKYCENLYNGGYRNERSITFWKPKLKDLAGCEASRWHAQKYSMNQMAVYKGFWGKVCDEAPLRYIKLCEEWPGFEWHHIEKHDNSYYSGLGEYKYSLSDGRIRESDTKEMAYPLKQDIGDAYTQYNERCKTIRTRTYYFEHLFKMALEEKYSQRFYHREFTILKLIINGREYIIGETATERKFGVIAYPEQILIEKIS